jgi:putative Ca2+/H+ antiporter (TMEM165/GDT1 family)
MGAWMLVPDSAPDPEAAPPRWGIFGTTLVAFFMLEMGDKTQIATVALAAEYADFYMVVAGTTIGMMLANVPAVLLGDKLTQRLPVRTLQIVAAIIMAALGVFVLIGIDLGG